MADFRKTVDKLSAGFYPLEMVQNAVQIIPVQWRKDIELACDVPGEEVTLDDVTLDTAGLARKVLNGTFIDVLIYMTPAHRDKIHAHIVKKMNALFAKFSQTFLRPCFLEFTGFELSLSPLDSRNPDFLTRGGKVSVIGFSLGSVISFDILTQQSEGFYVQSSLSRVKPEASDDAEVTELKKQMIELEMKIAEAKRRSPENQRFIFQVENYFMLGAPLGIFLTLRGHVIHSDVNKGLYPKCKHMYK